MHETLTKNKHTPANIRYVFEFTCSGFWFLPLCVTLVRGYATVLLCDGLCNFQFYAIMNNIL